MDINSINKDSEYFIIETDEIISLTTNNTKTYSFKIKNPTDPKSSFEYFVIDVSKSDSPKYFITRFLFSGQTNNSNFPYTVTYQNLTDYQIQISDFQVIYRKDVLCIDIIEIVSPRTFEVESYDITWYSCGSSGSSDTTSGDTDAEDSSSGTTSTTENSTTSSGGGTTSTTTTGSGSFPAPTGIRSVDYPDVLVDVLNYQYNGAAPQEMIDWVYNVDNFMSVKKIMEFLISKNYSTEAMSFAEQLIQAYAENCLIYDFPFFKYPKGSSYSTQYPKLTEYLKNKIPNLKINSFVINKLTEYSELSKDQVIKDLS